MRAACNANVMQLAGDYFPFQRYANLKTDGYALIDAFRPNSGCTDGQTNRTASAT
jgi:hypothetical protein